MRLFRLPAVALGLGIAAGITVMGCAGPPKPEVDAATAAVDKAAAAQADRYAAASFKAAQEARAALDAELRTQDEKWFKSYDRTKELAAAARAAGDKAAAEAAAGKEKANAAAARAKANAESRARALATAQKVGGQIRPPSKIKDVKPVYPAIAQSARVSGSVVIEATIDTDGKVINAKVLRSIPLLDQAALDAVQQWEYTPTLRNGVPIPVIVTVTVNFTL
jgi:TonB family protein